MDRRTFLTASAAAAAGVPTGAFRGGAEPLAAQPPDGGAITLDPAPLFELSPYLFMQFMEPLGATDGSVEAAWDHLARPLARRRGGRYEASSARR